MIHPVPKPAKRGPKERAPKGLRKNREPMKRTKLKNGAGSKRRGGHMFPRFVSEERRALIRSKPCLIAGRQYSTRGDPGHIWEHVCTSPTRACHLKSRGSGGQDDNNMWPGCDAAHEEQHRIGVPAFQKRWRVNLADECAKRETEFLWTQYLAKLEGTPEPR